MPALNVSRTARSFKRYQMSRCVSGLFDDPRVHVMTGAVSEAAISLLSPREAAAVADTVNKRRREYATARALIREGLARFFGMHGFDLLNAADRSPIWPAGIRGSISHSDASAWIALVDASYGTVGIDVEARAGLTPDLWRLTLLDEEIAALDRFDAATRERRALAVFSAKEALYKAQYAQSGLFMGFKALRVELGEDGSLRCMFQQPVGPFPKGYVVHGRWRDGAELVTAAWIPAR